MSRRLVLALVGGAALLAGCTSTVGGQAVDGQAAGGHATGRSGAPTTGPATSGGAPTSTTRTDLCSLLTWPDLGYPGNEGAASPTKTDTIQGAQASCAWVTQEFNAGYAPPPDPSCGNDTTVSGDLACAGDNAERLAQIENNSSFVEVTIAYLPGRPTRRPADYTQGGRTVYLNDQGTTCGGDTVWDGATIAAAVTDHTKAYGPPCTELKKVMALLIQREPHH